MIRLKVLWIRQGLDDTFDLTSLSDETKKNSSRPIPRLFFETKIFETETETFFRDQIFSRPIPRLFFETKCFRDQMFSRPIPSIFFETKCFWDRYRVWFIDLLAEFLALIKSDKFGCPKWSEDENEMLFDCPQMDLLKQNGNCDRKKKRRVC